MAKVAELVAEMSLNTARLAADMGKATSIIGGGVKRMESAFSGLKSAILSVASTSALAQLGRSALEMGDEIAKASQKFGIGAKELSVMRYAAEMSDVEFGSLGTALKKLSTSAADAAVQMGEGNDAFKAMGISVKDSSGHLKPTAVLFEEVAKKMSGYKDSAEKTNLAVKVFGKAGQDIIPVMNEWGKSSDKLRTEAERLGVVLSDEQAKNLEKYNDGIKKATLAVKGMAGAIISDLGAALDRTADKLAKMTAEGVDWDPMGMGQTAKSMYGMASNVKTGKISDILVESPDKKLGAAPLIVDTKKLLDEWLKLRMLMGESWDRQAKGAAEALESITSYREKGLNEIEKETYDIDKAFEGFLVKQAEAFDVTGDIKTYQSNIAEGAKTLEGLKEKLDAVRKSGLLAFRVAEEAKLSREAYHFGRYQEDARWSNTGKSRFDSAFQAGDTEGAISAFTSAPPGGTSYAEALSSLQEAQAQIGLYKQAWLDADQGITESIAATYSGMQNWISSSLQGLITGTMQVQDALKNLGKMMLSVVAEYIAKWLVSRLYMAVMGKTIMAAETAASVAAAATMATAWAIPAALVSAATYGSSAVAGEAALVAITATAMGIAATTSALGGAAHGGLGYVPAESTFLLQRGERVLSPRQNKDFTEFIGGEGGRGGQGQTIVLQLDGETLARWINKNAKRTGMLQLVPA